MSPDNHELYRVEVFYTKTVARNFIKAKSFPFRVCRLKKYERKFVFKFFSFFASHSIELQNTPQPVFVKVSPAHFLSCGPKPSASSFRSSLWNIKQRLKVSPWMSLDVCIIRLMLGLEGEGRGKVQENWEGAWTLGDKSNDCRKILDL